MMQSSRKWLTAAYVIGAGQLAIRPASENAAWADEAALKPGVPWVQFHSANFTRPAETGVDRQVNLDTGTQINDYAQFWQGRIKAPTSGAITFSAEADDGLELWIGDRLVIDGWGLDHARNGRLVVQSGQLLPMELRFFQSGGTAHLRLYWQWTGRQRELVPASAFWHQPSDLKRVQQMMQGKAKVPSRTQVKSSIYGISSKPEPAPAAPIRLQPGSYLFIDDHLIETCTGIMRKVNRPRRRLRGPVVTGKKGKGDACFQPYLEVIRDADTGRFRIWYGVPESASQSHVATMESDDGINWIRPHRVLADPSHIQFGVSVIDEGTAFPDPSKRFKLGYYGEGGLRVAASPDGLGWKPVVPRTVLAHRHDITNIYRDRVRNRYVALVSTYRTGDRWSGHRRISMLSFSKDLVHWRRPWLVITPDDRLDEGETQFYGMCGFLNRGDLLIGMVKVLRDDLAADAGGPAQGIGYTTLAWSRDGEHWTRDREMFFDRHPKAGAWDHAMAWIDCQLPVDDEVYLYYGGYARGHKVNRFEERQIGLVRMKRDRYVARQAGEAAGTLRTPLVILSGRGMTLNADAHAGEIRVQIVDKGGKPIDGFAYADCRPIKVDSLSVPVRWRGQVDALKGKSVRLEFSLRNASLFALDVQ